MPNLNRNSIFVHPTTKDEIRTIIGYLKDKSCGVDDVHSRVSKTISQYIV